MHSFISSFSPKIIVFNDAHLHLPNTPLELKKKIWIFFHFLYVILNLKCHYFLKFLHKWLNNDQFKNSGFASFMKILTLL